MPFTAFFLPFFERHISKPVKEVAEETEKLTGQVREAVEKTGAGPAEVLQAAKEPGTSFFQRHWAQLSPIWRTQQRLEELGRKTEEVAVAAAAKAAVPTALEAAIEAYCRANNVEYVPALAALTAEKMAREAPKQFKLFLPALRVGAYVAPKKEPVVGKEDAAIQEYLKALRKLRGTEAVLAPVSPPLKPAVAQLAKGRAMLVTAPLSRLEEVYEEVYHRPKIPAYLEGL